MSDFRPLCPPPTPAWKNMKHGDDGDGVSEVDSDGMKLQLLKQQDVCLKLRQNSKLRYLDSE